MKTVRLFYRILPSILERCRANPSFCEDVLAGDEEGLVESFNVDQTWDAIHFLISPNRAYPDQGTLDEFVPFDWAVVGKDVIHKGLNLGYGPACSVDAANVQKITERLNALTEHDLRTAFDPESMDVADVYPEIWTKEGAAAWDYIWDHFQRLREFYRRASDEKNAVITWIVPAIDPTA